jgi:hypothetical protein
MLETIKEIFAASPVMAWSIASVMFAMLVMAALWDKVAWWWLNTWMSFPLVGRISRLSKDLNRDSADNTWFKAEKALSRDYKKFIRIQNEHDFNEKIDYITKAGDNGRTSTPTWIFLLTALLVFVEAMGFSYVLAGWTIPGASESTQQYGALGIAFLISVILFAFTHFAGHELYKSNKIKHARREWAEDGRKHKFTTGTVPLARKQSTDDGQPNYTQLANRVGTHESYMITIATVVIVLIVAAGATYVRGQVLEKTLHQTVVGGQNQAEIGLSLNDDGLDMTVKGTDNPIMPDADLAQNQATKDKAMMDEINIDRHGGWGTFIILAFIFMFLQILGGLFGYRWGFAGSDSKAAFKSIGNGRYSTYADVRERYNEVADAAQAKLEALQQKLMERNADIGTEGMHTKNTFWKFMEMTRQEEARDRENQDKHTNRKSNKPDGVSIPASQETITAPLTVDQALQQLDSLQDKDDKRSYIKSLPPSMQTEVKNALMLAKAEAEKASATQTQLDDELDKLL